MPFIQQYTGLDTLSNVLLPVYFDFFVLARLAMNGRCDCNLKTIMITIV